MSNQNILAIILLVIFIGLLAVLWYFGKKKQVKKVIRALVIEAENNYGTGTGSIKYEVVVNLISKYLPPVLQFIFTPKFLDGCIQEAVEYIKTKTVTTEEGLVTIEEKLTPYPIVETTEAVPEDTDELTE